MIIKTIPKKGYTEKQAAIVVRYGGADHIHQLPSGQKVEMPTGIAHFLEHKMFEDFEVNMFEAFTKHGATVNAYTHFTHTAYYFSAIDNFEENLQLLFRLISTPHFTDENVEKEKGIILSEIDMYADNPYWQVYRGLHRGLFVNSPLRQDILGTRESVQSINKSQLYDCYSHFYTTDNMALICVGDIPTLDFSDSLDIFGPSGVSPEHEKEPTEAAELIIEKKMSVAIPLFQLGFKALYDIQADAVTLAASSILADMLAGESSQIYAELYDEGMIDNQFTAEYTGGTYYGIFLFSGASRQPEAVRDRILSTPLDSGRFETIKSKHIGRFIRDMNSISTISTVQADLFTKGQNIEDMLDAFHKVSQEDVERQYSHIRTDNCTLSVIRPS